MRKWIGLLVVSCLASAPAEAGWSFRQTSQTTGGRGSENMDTVTLVQFEGADARIDFEKMVENPMFGRGSYILLRGSAAGFRLVVCEGNRCIGPRVAVIRPRAGR